MTNEALNLIFWKEDSNNNNLGDDSTGGFTQNFNREYWIKQVKHFGDRNKSWLIQTFLDENRRKALTNDELQEIRNITIIPENIFAKVFIELIFCF